MHVTDVGIVGGQLERAVECELYSAAPKRFETQVRTGQPRAPEYAQECVREMRCSLFLERREAARVVR